MLQCINRIMKDVRLMTRLQSRNMLMSSAAKPPMEKVISDRWAAEQAAKDTAERMSSYIPNRKGS